MNIFRKMVETWQIMLWDNLWYFESTYKIIATVTRNLWKCWWCIRMKTFDKTCPREQWRYLPWFPECFVNANMMKVIVLRAKPQLHTVWARNLYYASLYAWNQHKNSPDARNYILGGVIAETREFLAMMRYIEPGMFMNKNFSFWDSWAQMSCVQTHITRTIPSTGEQKISIYSYDYLQVLNARSFCNDIS